MDKVEQGIVKCYSDKDIINELKHMFGVGVQSHYIEMLRTSCDSFDQDFFNASYKMLIESPDYISQEDFLDILELSDHAIGNGSSMGEKESFVLAQLLQLKYPGQVVVFCSDDSRARRNIAYVSGANDKYWRE